MPAQIAFIPWRFHIVLGLILLIVAGLVLRMIDLAVFDEKFLQTQGDERASRVINLSAFRGMITDRSGFPLAISTAVYSIWFNPKEIMISKSQLSTLSQLLAIPSAELEKTLQRHKKKGRKFVYLKREIPPATAKKIKALTITGLYLEQNYKRYYPEGEVTAHVVGFTNVDDHGQEGLELVYDQWLTGTLGKERVIKDRLGRVIDQGQVLQTAKQGNDLILSIDRRIQYLAYSELMAGIADNQAVSGSAIVLDVKTGEVLAMVNQPSFNPNQPEIKDLDAVRNRAVTDIFEPGSTIKAFSIASILDSGKFKPNSVIDTHPGWMRVGHHLVRDEHDNHMITLTQVLQLSSNVGVTKMILSVPPNQLWSLLHRVGFGESTNVGFPGERSGKLERRNNWDPFTLATLAFGYGISVTTLQLAQAYSVIANQGIKIPLTLLRRDESVPGTQVMNPQVAKEMLQLLEMVVTAKGATGTAAHVPGYRVAGKTGTAFIAGLGGYAQHRYVSSFVGIAPASRPRFIVVVMIRDPHGKKHLGGEVAAPVFEKIMEGTLRSYNVPPDNAGSI